MHSLDQTQRWTYNRPMGKVKGKVKVKLRPPEIASPYGARKLHQGIFNLFLIENGASMGLQVPKVKHMLKRFAGLGPKTHFIKWSCNSGRRGSCFQNQKSQTQSPLTTTHPWVQHYMCPYRAGAKSQPNA